MLALLAGCGGSDGESSEAAVQQRIEQARKEGAQEARQRDRIEGLQRRVKRLEGSEAAHPASVEEQPGEAATAGGAGSTALEAFHTPNVSCEIRTDGALCTVVSEELTFAFEGGDEAYVSSGSRVPEDTGVLAAWDSTVSAGSITCTIPPLDEPRGISCADSETGHGFEASRVPSRQRTY